jgi:hypothetical protein
MSQIQRMTLRMKFLVKTFRCICFCYFRKMFTVLAEISKRFIPTIPARKSGYTRPRKRALGAPVIHPNIRLRPKDYSLFEDRSGTINLVPPTRRNPSLNISEVLVGSKKEKYRRQYSVNLKPYKWITKDTKI